jgi:hypothetical protein
VTRAKTVAELNASLSRTAIDSTKEPWERAPLSRSSEVSHPASITPAFWALIGAMS